VREFREAPVKVALTNSFGFGGTNATLVLKHPDEASREITPVYHLGDLRVLGVGAVSPAGWGAEALEQAVAANMTLPLTECVRSYVSRDWSCQILQVPTVPQDRLPKFPRLRRASPITKYSLAAGLEALEQAGFPNAQGAGRLGIVQLMFNGCVQFSGKFYHEVIETPALASPLIFPETVYNAPASHVAAFLGVDGPATTLIGESSAIIEAISMAHTWLMQNLADHVLVVGAEECDWVAAEALSYYHPDLKASEGAGALLLSLKGDGLMLSHSVAHAFHNESERAEKLSKLLKKMPRIGGESGINLVDASEIHAKEAWEESPQSALQPRSVLGEGMGAGGAWQLVMAAHLAKKEGAPVEVLLPATLCAAYSAVIG
jgi:3-oxoacyl-(acyl-carrier-protein) synthase